MSNHLWDALMGPHANSDAPLLIRPDGTRMTYRQMARLTASIALQLEAEGMKPGDRVAAQVEKTPEALALYLATLRAGRVFLPLNPAYTTAEVAYFLEDASPAVVICDPARLAEIKAVAGRARCMTLDDRGEGGLIAASSARVDPHQPAERTAEDLAVLLYTSGTTGRSKGAMLTHDNLLTNATTLTETWRITVDDILLHALPIFHIHGLFVAVNTVLLKRAAMIWLPHFDTAEVIRLMPDATVMMGVPTYYTRLLDHDELTRDTASGMRLFISGSAPLLPETFRAFEERTGHQILERYGMTETGMNTSNPYEGERRAGSVGLPLDGVDLRILDKDRNEVGPGEVGMIQVRGPNVFKGYWEQAEKTSEDLAADGWFTTGDLGQRDEDGYVTIVGRGRDMVISGGINVYPREVEMLIDELPGVQESAVIGVPHPDFGEGVIAVVARQKGADPKPDEILAGLSGKLAQFKQPKQVLIIDELPKNAMGKVQKTALRAELAQLFSA